MKFVKLLSRRCVLTALLLTAMCFTPKASADLLTNTWFKLTLSVKGRTLDADGITVKRLNFTRTAYAHFVGNNPLEPRDYTFSLWTKGDAGWSNSYPFGTCSTIGENENFIPEMNVVFRGTNGDVIKGYNTPFLHTKTNSSGRLRSATISGTGDIYNGNINGKAYFGSFSILGTTTNPSKLPFTP